MAHNLEKHPAGPFTVRVSAYSVATDDFCRDLGQVFQSRHRSPKAAARVLAQIIARRTKLADDVHRCIPMRAAGRYVIEAGDGTRRSLNDHRRAFC